MNEWMKVKGKSNFDVKGGGNWLNVKGGESWWKGLCILGGMTGFVGALAYLHIYLNPRTEDGKPSPLSGAVDPTTAAATDTGFSIPTALWATPLTAAAVVAGAAAYKLWLELQKTELVALRIKPKQGFTMDTERVGLMARDFRTIYNKFVWRKKAWLKWQVVRTEKGMYEFRLICPSDKKTKNKLTAYIKTCYPDVIITEEAPTLPDFFDPTTGEATHMKLADKDLTLGLQSDLGNEMGDILDMMTPKSIVEFTFSPSSGSDIRRAGRKRVRELELQEKKGIDTRAEINQVRTRYTGKISAYDVFIDIWAYSGLEALASRISDRTERSNKLKGKPYYRFEEYRNPIQYETRKRVLAKWQMNRLTDKELSSFLMLPAEGHPVWEFIECELTKPKVSDTDFKGTIGIGLIDSDDPKQDGRPAKLQNKTLTNHGLIAGASGGGKGSALAALVKDWLPQFIQGKKDSVGITVCDPHNTMNLLIISYLLDAEKKGYNVPWHKVKVVSFGTLGERYPVAMNLLHQFKGDTVDQVATDLEHVILSAFNSEGMSKGVSDLQRAIQGLLHEPQTSILDITRLFEYSPDAKELREQLITSKAFNNEVVKMWLDKSNAKINKDKKDISVSSVDTRLASLVTKQSIQRFHLRDGNYFNVADILANGDLVLCDFLGAQPEIFKLVAGWLAKKYYYESQARGVGKRPHLLIFDEVQKFSVESIYTQIIRENRKFNCGLVLATQQVDRLNEELAEAITSNAGFVLSVRQEAGAPKMAKLLGKPFVAEELQKLNKGLEAAIKSDDGKARLKLEYPSFLLDGKTTWKDSTDEAKAIQIAEKKFLELLARDHVTAAEADKEVYNYVHRVRDHVVTVDEVIEEIEQHKQDNVVPLDRAAGGENQPVMKKRKRT